MPRPLASQASPKNARRTGALLFLSIGLIPSVLNSRDPLRIQISPAIARAPALLTVRVNIAAVPDDRLLQVVAESPDFYRSSEIPIDGTNSGPLKVFEFRNLPTGLYQVTGVLVGTHGPRATVSRLAKVEPSVGSAR